MLNWLDGSHIGALCVAVAAMLLGVAIGTAFGRWRVAHVRMRRAQPRFTPLNEADDDAVESNSDDSEGASGKTEGDFELTETKARGFTGEAGT